MFNINYDLNQGETLSQLLFNVAHEYVSTPKPLRLQWAEHVRRLPDSHIQSRVVESTGWWDIQASDRKKNIAKNLTAMNNDKPFDVMVQRQ